MEEELDIAQLFLRELGSDRFDGWLEEKIPASRDPARQFVSLLGTCKQDLEATWA